MHGVDGGMARRVARLRWIVLVGVIGLAGACAASPDPAPDDAEQPKVTVSEFGLGPGDEIEVVVYLHDDLTRKIRVPGSGIIFFPLVGEINVHGMGVTELRRLLTERLGQFVVDPQVNVEVAALRSQKVYVLGEVNAPTVFPVDTPIEAVEAISKAGGFTPQASQSSVMLIRGRAEKPEIKRLDLKGFLTGDQTGSLLLQPGDIVYVPRTFVANVDRFFSHALTALLPIMVLEQGIALYPQVQDTLTGKTDRSRTTNIVVTPATP